LVGWRQKPRCARRIILRGEHSAAWRIADIGALQNHFVVETQVGDSCHKLRLDFADVFFVGASNLSREQTGLDGSGLLRQEELISSDFVLAPRLVAVNDLKHHPN